MNKYVIKPQNVKEFLASRAYNWNGKFIDENYKTVEATSENFNGNNIVVEIITPFNTIVPLTISVTSTEFTITHHENGFDNFSYTNDHSKDWRKYLLNNENEKEYKHFLKDWAKQKRNNLIQERDTKKAKIDEQYKFEIDDLQRLINIIEEKEAEELANSHNA